MVRELHEFLATEILARELDKSLNEIEESGVVEYAGDGAVADFHGVGRDFARENAMRSDSENVDGVVRLFPRDAIGLGVDDKQALRGEEQNQRALIDRAMNHVFVLEIHDLFSNQNAHVFHADRRVQTVRLQTHVKPNATRQADHHREHFGVRDVLHFID